MVNSGYYHYLLAKRSGIKIQKLAMGFLCGVYMFFQCVCVCVGASYQRHACGLTGDSKLVVNASVNG